MCSELPSVISTTMQPSIYTILLSYVEMGEEEKGAKEKEQK